MCLFLVLVLVLVRLPFPGCPSNRAQSCLFLSIWRVSLLWAEGGGSAYVSIVLV